MIRIAVAASGGADSLCALLALKNAGHEVFAIHGLFLPRAEPARNLADFCRRKNIPLEIFDLKYLFAAKVSGPCARDYAAGLTPNPCAACNREIKFGALSEAALARGADFFATGHYARRDQDGVFCPAADSGKDQAYFLSLTPKECFEKTIFPLADLTKSEARRIAASAGFDAAPESLDACFLENGPPSGRPGPILLRLPGQEDWPTGSLAQIGRHDGSAHTIGQRKGFGVAYREPLYCREIAGDALVLAPRRLLDMAACVIGSLNYFVDPELWPRKIFARFRYRQKLCPVKIVWRESGLAALPLEPRLAAAPGQVAAFYDAAGRLLAGGIAEKISFAGDCEN